MKFLLGVVALLLLHLSSSAEAATDEESIETRLFSDCIEPSASYLKSSSDENKALLASCLLLDEDNVSTDSCTENVEIYLEEKSVTTQRALIDCLSITLPKWNDPLHYRAQENDFRPWHERILDRYPGQV